MVWIKKGGHRKVQCSKDSEVVLCLTSDQQIVTVQIFRSLNVAHGPCYIRVPRGTTWALYIAHLSAIIYFTYHLNTVRSKPCFRD